MLASAAVISNFAIFKQPGEIADHKAWLAWDEQWLYIAMEISHPAPKYIKQTVFEADGPVQADDSVEVFLDQARPMRFTCTIPECSQHQRRRCILSRWRYVQTGANVMAFGDAPDGEGLERRDGIFD